jgi:hypothetical protein
VGNIKLEGEPLNILKNKLRTEVKNKSNFEFVPVRCIFMTYDLIIIQHKNQKAK